MDISGELQNEIRELMSSFHCNEKDDFQGIADISYVALLEVSGLESRYQVYLPMLRHVIESIGLGALHAIHYSAMSLGETRDLSQEFMSTQILGLNELIITFDCLANEVHQLGIGVLVNDLPDIPFMGEYAQNDGVEAALFARPAP